jgi:hypothetical protein
MCICTTRDIKASLRSEQQEVYDEDPEEEEKNNFRCVLDFQTNVDVAFTWMQYVNHFEEWKFKKLNVAAPDGEQRWTPKFTGVMGGRKNGGCVLDDEGLALYERVKTWIAQFKIDENYEVFQKLCNSMSRQYGLIKDVKSKRKDTRDVREVHDNDEASASALADLPVFDFGAVVSPVQQEVGV